MIAVGGGKGGVGKSLISANLGVHLAQSGLRVIMVDADLGGANLHTCLGIPPPERTLSDFVSRRYEELADVVSQTSIPRLGLVSGALDFLDAANPQHTQKRRLLREISRLDADAIIIDLGGGTGFNILDFFLIAEHGILGVVPEPTSIENAYRFIKAVYYRRLRNLEVAWNLRPLIDEAAAVDKSKGPLAPMELLAYVDERDPEAGALLRSELARFPVELVVNQTRTSEEERLGQAVSTACRRHFGVAVRFLASIPHDEAVLRAVRRRRPVMLEEPACGASHGIRRIAVALGLGE